MTNQKKIEVIFTQCRGKKKGMLSNEIIDKLCSKYNVQRETATKILSRVKAPVNKIKGINFPHNSHFYYLGEFDYLVKNTLHKFLNEYNTSESLVLNALMSRDGACLKKYLKIFSGLPDDRIKKQKSFDKVIKSLLEIKMIYELKDSGGKEFYSIYNVKDSIPVRPRFISVLEDEILKHLKKLFYKLNLCSKDACQIRTDNLELPKYGNFYWSLTAPCYIDGIKNGSKPGFLMCDIFLNGVLNKETIKPILRKYETSKYQRRKTRIVPALFFKSMKPNLLKDLRKKGFLTVSVKTFNGDELLEALNSLLDIFSKDLFETKDSKKIPMLITALFNMKIGHSSNMKGFLFNLVVRDLLQKQYSSPNSSPNMEMGKIISLQNKGRKEIDVYFENQSERYIVETKAFSILADYHKTTIREFIDKKYEFFKEFYKNSKLKIMFVSCLPKEKIKELNQEYKDYNLITFYGYDYLINIISGKKLLKPYSKILEYFKE